MNSAMFISLGAVLIGLLRGVDAGAAVVVSNASMTCGPTLYDWPSGDHANYELIVRDDTIGCSGLILRWEINVASVGTTNYGAVWRKLPGSPEKYVLRGINHLPTTTVGVNTVYIPAGEQITCQVDDSWGVVTFGSDLSHMHVNPSATPRSVWRGILNYPYDHDIVGRMTDTGVWSSEPWAITITPHVLEYEVSVVNVNAIDKSFDVGLFHYWVPHHNNGKSIKHKRQEDAQAECEAGGGNLASFDCQMTYEVVKQGWLLLHRAGALKWQRDKESWVQGTIDVPLDDPTDDIANAYHETVQGASCVVISIWHPPYYYYDIDYTFAHLYTKMCPGTNKRSALCVMHI